MDSEYEEEVIYLKRKKKAEQLVVVELSGIINNDFLSKCGGTCKILDIDSDRPMMQVGPYVFAGEYEEALGTCVLFDEKPPKGHADSVPQLKYVCHTAKKLMMQRIFLTEKKVGDASTGIDDGDMTNTSRQDDKDQHGVAEEGIDSPLLGNSAVGSGSSSENEPCQDFSTQDVTKNIISEDEGS
ncbi:general transcription factor 3C polypeptide 6 isoform X1 [Cynoglossus semilaevis]|uniref:general transcription factor 3C polypeptide 6 isoform X1 n=1 Tax=Cynoglossus semilaevis TaxID=244447 RepID=UPI0007DCAA6E|nr:general transcription factor 3C polypeptide 6 isoform X1 [Cynoglossus semilaevis]XP_024912049.1 general transcription factor 3C polypeptide 6 isoform X1 [Cynoglossus semilaevis]